MKKNLGKFFAFLTLFFMKLFAKEDIDLTVLDSVNSYPTTAINLDEVYFYTISALSFLIGILVAKWMRKDHV